MTTKLLSPSQYARRHGLGVQHVNRLCRAGRLEWFWVGSQRAIPEDATITYKKSPKGGRPPRAGYPKTN